MRWPVLALVVVAVARPAGAADLQPETVAAFDRYVRVSEARMSDASQPFLWMDSQPASGRRDAMATLRSGGFVIDRLQTRDGGHDIEVPDGLIHHWVGVVFVPGGTVDAALALLQDYDRHDEIYQPNVARSALRSRDGNRFSVSLRFFMKKAITVVVNSEHEAIFTRHSPDRASSRIRSTRIAEVESPDTSSERELPVGHDGGYLWRLNSYWRVQQRDGGVYIQCESITLTRGIPFGLGWIVKPFVTSIPRETLAFTLDTTRRTLTARSPS